MRNPFRLLAFSFVFTGLMLAGLGCVKIDATVSVERDGSGSLRAIYGMPTYIINQADLARDLSASLDLAAGKTNSIRPELDIPFLFDEAVLRAKFGTMATDGIILESIKLREQGGWNYVDFTLKFKTLASLFKQSFFRDVGVTLKRIDETSCKFIVTPPPSGNSPEVTSVVMSESLNKMTPFLSGLRVVARVVLPGDIRNSNSLMSDNRRATWEWDFEKDQQVLVRLAREKMVVVFDASEFRLKEFEKPAGTTLLGEKN